MATRKHNDFLDGSESEDDGQGYDSELEDLQKGGRSIKRRKVEGDLSDAEDSAAGPEDIEEEEEQDANAQEELTGFDGVGEKEKTSKKSSELPGVSKPLSKKSLIATEAAVKKSGVVYLSRIPPFMKPQKVRSLLEPYGTINRIFLTPEDPVSHTRRVKNGGNKKRSFTDGWVEFVNKIDARNTCELLNARTIGGKKGTYYHDDIWNLLYLKGFKWHNLTEQIAAENAERASRMRAEISKTTKENKEFVQNVERAKVLDGIQSKRAAKRRKDNEEGPQIESTITDASKSGKRTMNFKQTAVASKKKQGEQPDQVKRVLSKIF